MPGNVDIRAGNKLQHEKKTCSSVTGSGHAGNDGQENDDCCDSKPLLSERKICFTIKWRQYHRQPYFGSSSVTFCCVKGFMCSLNVRERQVVVSQR